MKNLDIWHKFEKQGDKVLHTVRTRNANYARAMMVAPQLLEALVAIVDAGYLEGAYQPTVDMALSAISKAKGE